MLVLEVLDSILEVGIGIAGFSGVIIAFGRGQWSSRVMLLLPTLLDLAFVVIVLAFVPMILLSAKIPHALIWQITSGFTAMYIAVIVPYRLARMKQLGLVPSNRGLALLVNAFIFGLSLSNLLWLRSEWPHLVALVSMLVLAFGVFSFLVAELWTVPATSNRTLNHPR